MHLPFLRKLLLPVLQATAFDLSIDHHWVPQRKIRLNSFLHKGYWYHGRRRERKTLEIFRELVGDGMLVAEVGGHIGYLSVYFASLVGPAGHVVVFEPGQNNLPYLRRNTEDLHSIEIIEKGAAATTGTLTFYEESLTGQNNSFVENFSGLRSNRNSANVEVRVNARQVEVVTLDEFFQLKPPDFVKIDVEGFEFEVLAGSRKILTNLPAIMVEVQSRHAEIFELLSSFGYVLFNEELKPLHQPADMKLNTFALHAAKHGPKLADLGLSGHLRGANS